MSAELDDRFNDGYKAAEAHWKKRWHAANAAHQGAVTEIERLTEDCRFNRRARERVEDERDALADRLAAVPDAKAEALREAATDTNCADDYHLLIDRAARLAGGDDRG